MALRLEAVSVAPNRSGSAATTRVAKLTSGCAASMAAIRRLSCPSSQVRAAKSDPPPPATASTSMTRILLRMGRLADFDAESVAWADHHVVKPVRTI